MKLISFIILFSISCIASAASYQILTGYDVNDDFGKVTLTSNMNPDSSTLAYSSPAQVLGEGEYLGAPFYNENRFSNGTDVYYTPMGGYVEYDFFSDVNIEFEWFSNSVTNGSFSFSGNTIPIVSNANGSFITSIPMGVTEIGFLGLAQSIDSSMSLKFTVLPPSPVPLPAAFWMFAPALLGFMGFRKISKSKTL